MARRSVFDPRGAGVTETVGSVPVRTGDADVSEAFAETFAGLGQRLNDAADRATKRRAAIEGAIAGQNPNFEPTRGNTIAERTFDKAAIQSFRSRLETRARDRLSELAEEHRGDPNGLESAIQGYQSGVEEKLQQTAPEALPEFRARFQRLSEPYVREAAQQKRQVIKQEAQASLYDSLESYRNTAERLAMMEDATGKAALDLAAERESLLDTLRQHGPPESFTFAGVEMEADPTRPGVITPAEMEQKLQTFDEEVYKAKAMGEFQKAENKAAFLEEWSEAERKNTESPLNLEQVGRIESRMRALVKQEQTAVKERRQELADLVDSAEESYKFGKTPPGEDSLLAATQKFPELNQRMKIARDNKELAGEFMQMPPAEQRATLNQIQQSEVMSERQVDLTKRLTQLHEETKAGLKNDPVSWANKTGLVEVEPIDLTDPSTLQNRAEVSRKLKAHYGIQHHGLTTAEVDGLTQAVNQADADGKTRLAGALSEGMRPARLQSLADDLSDEDPIFSLGVSITDEAPELGRQLFAAQDLLKETNQRVLPTETQYRAEADDVLGRALEHSPRTRSQVVQGALMMEAKQRAGTGSLDPNEWSPEAFRANMEKLVGGIIEWQGRNIVVPERGMTRGEFDKELRQLGREDLRQAGEMPVYITAKGEEREVGPGELYEEGVLESVGDGRYLVRFGNGYLQGPDGPYTLDLNRAVEVGPIDTVSE